MTRVARFLIIAVSFGLVCSGAALAATTTLNIGGDLAKAVKDANAGDTILLRGDHANITSGASTVATYEVTETLKINKDLTIKGEPNFMPTVVEIVGRDAASPPTCSPILLNGDFNDTPPGVNWDQYPSNAVIVQDAAGGMNYYAQFSGHDNTNRPVNLSQPVVAGASVAGPFVYEIRYLLPVLPYPDNGKTAKLSFKLKSDGVGSGGEKLEILSEDLVNLDPNKVAKKILLSSTSPNYDEYTCDVLDPANAQDWTYLIFRATVNDENVHFYIDDVRLLADKVDSKGVTILSVYQPLLGGGFENDIFQNLWLQSSASDPILVPDQPATGEWSARFGQDPAVAKPLASRSFLHFYYRVDNVKQGDVLNVQFNTLDAKVPAATPSGFWKFFSREVDNSADTVKFSVTGLEGTFSIDDVYIGPAGTDFSKNNRVVNYDFEAALPAPWTPVMAVIYAPAGTSGYNSSKGFARLGKAKDLSSRDLSDITQTVTIPTTVRYLEFHVMINEPHPVLVNQFEVRLNGNAVFDISDKSKAYLEKDSAGNPKWKTVRLDLMGYRGASTSIEFLGWVFPGSDTKFLLDEVCLVEESFPNPVIEVTSASKVTLENLSIRTGSPNVLVSDGTLMARRIGLLDATTQGVQFGASGKGVLANCSISDNKNYGVDVVAGADQVTLIQCTLKDNAVGGVRSAGATVDSYACIVDQSTTFDVAGSGVINSHQDWVPGGLTSPDYGSATLGAGDTLARNSGAPPGGELLDMSPPYYVPGTIPKESNWPGNLGDNKDWPQSKQTNSGIAKLPAGVTLGALASRDFENNPRATAAMRTGADEPVRYGTGVTFACSLGREYIGQGGQLEIFVSTTAVSPAVPPPLPSPLSVYIVPELLYAQFDPSAPAPGTYLLLDDPSLAATTASFTFYVPFPQNDPAMGVWIDMPGTGLVCWEGRAHVFVGSGVAISEPGCTFVIDTIAPVLDPSDKTRNALSFVADHNDTCVPNIPLPSSWRPGVFPLPYSDATWSASNPQVFFNVDPLSSYVVCAQPDTALSFQAQVNFYDPLPLDDGGYEIPVERSGFDSCSPCVLNASLGGTVWSDGLPPADSVIHTAECWGGTECWYTTGSWSIINTPYDASSWSPREARFEAIDRAGNSSEKTPPLELWWMREARVSVSGPGDSNDPVFTWSFVRSGDPKNVSPCEPIFRYGITTPTQVNVGDPWIINPATLMWSDWLSTADVGYHISRTTKYDNVSTFGDRISSITGVGYVAFFIQAADEAGNVSDVVFSDFLNNLNQIEGEPGWFVTPSAAQKLSTKVSPHFWHNAAPYFDPASGIRPLMDQGEVDLGSSLRVPFFEPQISPVAIDLPRIEAEFKISLEYPDTVLEKDMYAYWELFRDGVRIARSDPSRDPANVVGPLNRWVTIPGIRHADSLLGRVEYDLEGKRWAKSYRVGDMSVEQTKDVSYLFQAFAFIDQNGNALWDTGEPRDPEGASVRFTVVSGRPNLETQPIKLIEKGE